MYNKELTPADLDVFFSQLQELENNYVYWVGELPKKLIISQELIGKLAKVPGFYQRPELRSEVTVYSPVVRHFKLVHSVVTLRDDYDEKYMHLE